MFTEEDYMVAEALTEGISLDQLMGFAARFAQERPEEFKKSLAMLASSVDPQVLAYLERLAFNRGEKGLH
jgi:hypothetical protein